MCLSDVCVSDMYVWRGVYESGACELRTSGMCVWCVCVSCTHMLGHAPVGVTAQP